MSAEALKKAQALSQTVPPPSYEFLAHPPPPKQHPNQPSVLIPPPTPIHSRRRTSTTSVISAWVARVQPGSPAPISPTCSARRSSVHAFPRRPSVTRIARRASVVSARRPSASFVSLLETPVVTPYLQDYKPDLAAYGYTSTIVPLSMTSQTTDRAPMPIPSLKARKVLGELIIPATPTAPPSPAQSPKKGAFKRLRSRLRAQSMPPPPRSPTSKRRRASPAAVARRKRAAYAHAAPPLQSELALLQFADGGSEAAAVRRLVAAGDGVFRDAQGGVWWDEYEAWEYAHLLGGEGAGAAMGADDWVAFAAEEERRGSAGSLDSELDASYAVREAHTANDGAAFGGAAALHLRKPALFLDAFVPGTPTSPVRDAPASRPKGKARRRPAPLTLSPAQGPPMTCETNSPDDARAAFLENSFAPEPPTDVAPEPPTVVAPVAPPRTRNMDLGTIAKRPSRINLGGSMKGFLRAVSGRKD